MEKKLEELVEKVTNSNLDKEAKDQILDLIRCRLLDMRKDKGDVERMKETFRSTK